MLISIPKRYIPNDLTEKDKSKIKKELLRSRRLYKKNKYHTRKKVKSFKSKESKHITKAKQTYKINRVSPNKHLAHKTGCSVKGLKKIMDKGMGAYYSSGSRPNQTAHSWGIARLASAITGGKSAAVDFNIIEKHCKKTGKAYKNALLSKRKHGKGNRKTKSVKIKDKNRRHR